LTCSYVLLHKAARINVDVFVCLVFKEQLFCRLLTT